MNADDTTHAGAVHPGEPRIEWRTAERAIVVSRHLHEFEDLVRQFNQVGTPGLLVVVGAQERDVIVKRIPSAES